MFSFPFVSITVRFLSFRALSLRDYSFFVETLIIRFRIPGRSLFEIDILVWYKAKFCQKIRCIFWNCDWINEQLIAYIRVTLCTKPWEKKKMKESGSCYIQALKRQSQLNHIDDKNKPPSSIFQSRKSPSNVRNPFKKKEKRREKKKDCQMKWRREHTGHYSRVSTDEYAINPDPVPPPRILVSPSGVSCSYPRFVYISPGRIYVWSPAPSLVLSFDDRSRVCSQLQLQFPGSPAPERSPANSPSLSLSLSLSLILFVLNACLLSLFLFLFNACLLCRAISLQRTPALSFSLSLSLTCAFSLFLFLFKARRPPFSLSLSL